MSCGAVGTRLWTGQQPKALVLLWQALDFSWHCLHRGHPMWLAPGPKQQCGHRWQWGHSHQVLGMDSGPCCALGTTAALPVLQSPTLRCTQQCWAGRAESKQMQAVVLMLQEPGHGD